MPLTPASKGKPRHSRDAQVRMLTDWPAVHLVAARKGGQALGTRGSGIPDDPHTSQRTGPWVAPAMESAWPGGTPTVGGAPDQGWWAVSRGHALGVDSLDRGARGEGHGGRARSTAAASTQLPVWGWGCLPGGPLPACKDVWKFTLATAPLPPHHRESTAGSC